MTTSTPLIRDAAPARARAIALLSGGLDSTLAISAMLDQGIEMLALNFIGPFCTCTPRKTGGCHLASTVARQLGIEIRVISKGMDYLRVVEHPRFGHGRGLNPCIDCRIFMLRVAAEMLSEVGASFVITGEVLGQRPMSQHRAALELIERESGLSGRLLRPLSAHLLDETIPEREGLVRRDLLLDIQGRARRSQLDLACRKGLDVFGCPSGGCLLTDPLIARRMRDVFKHCSNWEMRDAKLTTLGRHLRIHDQLKVIIGRNKDENRRLLDIAGDLPFMEPTVEPGPTIVLRGAHTDDDLTIIGGLLRFFSKKATAPDLEVALNDGDRRRVLKIRDHATVEEVTRWTI